VHASVSVCLGVVWWSLVDNLIFLCKKFSPGASPEGNDDNEDIFPSTAPVVPSPREDDNKHAG